MGQVLVSRSDVECQERAFLAKIRLAAQCTSIVQYRYVSNSEIPNFDHLALASGGWIYMDAAGIAPQQKGNEKLSWETTWTTNLGFHLGFFERFNVDLELYHKRTSDMLMEVPQSYSEGNNGFRWDNIGVMTNMGVELAINADVLRLRFCLESQCQCIL